MDEMEELLADIEDTKAAGRRLRMKADCRSTKLLVSQLQEFPVAEHGDNPDALEMAVRLAAEMLAGVPDDGLGDRLPVERDWESSNRKPLRWKSGQATR